MNRAEMDLLELGLLPAGHLLAEQAPCDQAREHHLFLVADHALSRSWAAALADGTVTAWLA